MSATKIMAAFIRRNSIIINGLCLPLILLGVAAIFGFMVSISRDIGSVQSTQTMMSTQFSVQNRNVDAILARMRSHDHDQDKQIQGVRDMARDNQNSIKTLGSRVDRLERQQGK